MMVYASSFAGRQAVLLLMQFLSASASPQCPFVGMPDPEVNGAPLLVCLTLRCMLVCVQVKDELCVHWGNLAVPVPPC